MQEMRDDWKGQKVDSYANTEIYEGFPYSHYEIVSPELDDDEATVKDVLTGFILGKWGMDEAQLRFKRLLSDAFMEEFREKIIKPITYTEAVEYFVKPGDFNALKLSLIAMLKAYFPESENYAWVAESVLADTIGYGKLSVFMKDDNLEEVMVNGYERKVFVFHKKYGHCKTNLEFSIRKELDSILQKIAKTVGKKFDADHPLMDAGLPDGNRANATFSYVTHVGPSLTIRKFNSVPMSIIDLIKNRTLSSEVAAFLWVAIEGFGIEPMNTIIAGGSGSGKTTSLNALLDFIRFPERIITIEDTPELQLGGRENWVQLESRPEIKDQTEISMDDLLKNALRMRPDRLIVGEVRGVEAQTLFIAMDTGHKGILGTIHANTAKDSLLRLRSEPMNVPEQILPLLNLIIVQYRYYEKGKGIQRRMLSLTEISSMERQPLISNIYEIDHKTDELRRTDTPSFLLELLATSTQRTKKDVEKEIAVRKKIIDWMISNNISKHPDVIFVIQQYYYNPESVMEKVLSDTKM